MPTVLLLDTSERMQYSTRQLLILDAFVCIVVAVSARGNCLSGQGAGAYFGVLASASLFVAWRVFGHQRRFKGTARFAALLFGSCVILVLMLPHWLNPDVAYFVDARRIERETSAQLRSTFENDPRYSELDYQCGCRKSITVSVDGILSNQSDLIELRSQIFNNCAHVTSRWLYWNVSVSDPAATHNDTDLTIFGD